MRNMIKASFYKMFHDKALRVILVCAAIGVYLYVGFWCRATDAELLPMDQFTNELYAYPFLGGFMIPIIVGVLVLFSTEFKDQSWKLMIAKGCSLKDYYFAKLLCCLTLEVMISFVVILATTFLGAGVYGMPIGGDVFKSIVIFFFAQCLANASLTVLVYTLLFIIRNGAIAACFCALTYVFGGRMIAMTEEMLNMEVYGPLYGIWVTGQYRYAYFNEKPDWIFMAFVLLGYLLACSLAALVLTRNRDVDMGVTSKFFNDEEGIFSSRTDGEGR